MNPPTEDCRLDDAAPLVPLLPALRMFSAPCTPFASFWMGGIEGAHHVNGIGRVARLHESAHEVAHEGQRARRAGVPIEGICLYPLVDRPDRDDAAHRQHSGLRDVEPPTASTRADDPSALPCVDRPAVPPFTRRLGSDCAAALAAWRAV